MAIGEAVGGILGGILGNNAAKMDRRHQKDTINQMVQEYTRIGYPPDYARALILQEFQQTGQYTPELEADLNASMAESEVNKIEEDPSLRKAQLGVLSSMQDRAKVGLSAEDRASLNQVRGEVQRDAEAKRQQVLQQMQARGMGGSGAALIAQLQAGQDAQNLASQQSDNLMSQAQSKALQAIGQSSDMASNLRGQDFQTAKAKAGALDERNRFLQENSIARQRSNVGALNEAQQANLKEQQGVADANVRQSNEEKQRQAVAKQQQYRDKLNYAAGITGQQSAQAKFYGDTANAKVQANKDMGKGAGGLAESIATYAMSDETKKENIDESGDEGQKFMDRISTKFRK